MLVVGLARTLTVLAAGAAQTAAAGTDAQPAPQCVLSFASGEPLRHAERTHAVMRLGARCEERPNRLRWYANGGELEVVRTEKDRGDLLYVLRLGRVEGERLTIEAVRSGSDRSVAASVTAQTQRVREPLATLELPGQGAIEFIPKNREARVDIVAGGGNLRLLPLPGAYKVRRDANGTYVQGEPAASGDASLRFAYRGGDLPAGLADIDLAILTESVARPIRAATLHLGSEPPRPCRHGACMSSYPSHHNRHREEVASGQAHR
jgi:hypothetical protein